MDHGTRFSRTENPFMAAVSCGRYQRTATQENGTRCPVNCIYGLHVTNEPAKWFAVGASVYAVECEEFGGQKDDKAVFRRVRLTRELTCDELRDLRIAGDGEWFITSGIAFAFGSCKVVALDNSQVVARGNSQVVARGNSQVVARDNSKVDALDNSQVVARGNSQVVASDNSTINILDIRCTVTEDGNAVVIDRTQSPPVVRCGWLTGTTSAATKGGDVTDGDSLA